MRAILVDDEPLALTYMEGLLKKIGDVDIIGKYINPHKALAGVIEEQPDVVFLDIEMPEINGIELAERIQGKSPGTLIVFVTAFNEYAVKAFELHAVDYIVKPVQRERLRQTLLRIPRTTKEVFPSPRTAMVCTFQSLSFAWYEDALEEIDIRWRTSKVRGVFAFLLQHRGSYVRKDTLLELFWPGADWEKGFMQLYSTIYQIRKTIASIDFSVVITNHENGYRLDLEEVKLDIEEWEAGLKNLPALTNETLPEYQRLLEFYRGDYLVEEDYLWAESERERLRILWLQHCSKVADYLADNHQVSEAILLYLRIQTSQPYVDHSYFKLMQLYSQVGDIRGVEQQFDQLTKMLKEEYDAEPRQGIREWYNEWAKFV